MTARSPRHEQAFRAAEAAAWSSVGRRPTEQFVPIASTGTSVRVQEVGDGVATVFLHGGPNAGTTWAPMIGHVDGLRCLVVDRPGTGLSSPVELRPDNLVPFAEAFLADVLDGLGLEKAHVVASSFGGYLALHGTASHPGRVDRMVQMACPAFAPGMLVPPFMSALTNPIARGVINLLPPSRRASRSIMRQIGHGHTLDHGGLPAVFEDWYLALQRHTDTMRNDGGMIARGIPVHDQLTIPDDVLAAVATPTLFLWGEDDGFGGVDVAHRILAPMPDAELVMLPDSGHLPWLDDPAHTAKATQSFLEG